MRRFLAALFFCSVFPAAAYDFGLVIQQSPEFTNTQTDDAEAEFNYRGNYSPWFSSVLGKTGTLYLSAKVSTAYEGGEWTPENMPVLPEVGRFEFAWRPASSFFVEAGRVWFQDPLGIIASGLFDGFNGSAVSGQARLSIGAFYTGLLYKETAGIMMTSSDVETYADPDNYFASRRLLFSASAEFPNLTSRSGLVLNTLVQFDVNSKAAALNTQYLTAQYTFLPLDTFSLTGTAVLGLAEDQDADIRAHFAAAAGMSWEVPGALRDMLQGEFRWSSGMVNKSVTAFTPLTGVGQGQVFSPNLSGLMTFEAKYTARLHKNFSTSTEGTYFIRTDEETVTGSEYPLSSARLLGGELYETLSWTPKSDLMVTLGGGAFFPNIGNVFVSGASIRWKIMAGLVLLL
jgi:hypothetical protein